MILFGVVAAVMIALAVAALLPVLLRQRVRARSRADEDLRAVYRERLAALEGEHGRGNLSAEGLQEARDELEREVLQDADRAHPADTPTAAHPARALAVVLVLGVPVVGLVLYGVTGRPELIAGQGGDRLPPEAAERYGQMAPQQRIAELEDYVERHPEAPRAWRLLGDAYRAREQFGDAYSAFQRARAAGGGDDATLIARQAEALLLANGRRFTTGVRRLIDEALEVAPHNTLALLLAGHAARAEGRTQAALEHWRTLADTLPEGGRSRQAVEQLIARTRGESGAGAAAEPGATTGGGTAADADGARVTVRVRLAEALAGQAPAGAPVFVFARAAGNDGGPPLAVARTSVDTLPAKIALTDGNAMMEGQSLSRAERVVVTARVSASGGVRPQPGDLEGRSEPVAVGADARTEITIDRRIE